MLHSCAYLFFLDARYFSLCAPLFSWNLPQRDEKRWERSAVDGKGQAQALPVTSPLVFLLALVGGLQVTGGFRHLKKGKDININYHKVLERSFFFSSLTHKMTSSQ